MNNKFQISRRTLLSALFHIFIIFGVLVYISPILIMIVGSLKPDELVLQDAGSWRAFFPRNITFQNYADVFNRVQFAKYMLNSIFISGSIVLSGLVINSMAGYAFARMQWRGRDFLLTIFIAIMIIPFEAIAVPLFYQVTCLGWRNTYAAQIIPFCANAFTIYLFYSFFLGLPKEFEESAIVEGAGHFRIFFKIIVPNSKPAFASAAIVTFLFYWGFFLWPLIITSGEEVRPLPVAIANFKTLPPLKWGDIMAFGVMMVFPILMMFLFFQRWFIRGLATTGIK